MAFPDTNVVESEPANWRLIVYPILALLLLVAGITSYFAYRQHAVDERESEARAGLVAAHSTAELLSVASRYPKTIQAGLAEINAGQLALSNRDFVVAENAFTAVLHTAKIDPQLRDSAQLGLAATYEAKGETPAAIAAYLRVAHEGNTTPYAAYAFYSVATIYLRKDDKANARQTFTELAALNNGSPFLQNGAQQLANLNAEAAAQPSTNPQAKGVIAAPSD